jgi:hypothetical protein
VPAAWPPTHRGQQCGPIRRGELRWASRAGGVLQAFDALCQLALEPAQYRGLALADDGRDLGSLEPLLCREEDHLRAGPPPGIFGAAIEVRECLVLP